MRNIWMVAVVLAGGLAGTASAQEGAARKGIEVRRITPPNSRFASAIWAGDTLYLAGQMASPVTPDVYGDTKTQTLSVLTKIQALLKEQGLTMGAKSKVKSAG